MTLSLLTEVAQTTSEAAVPPSNLSVMLLGFGTVFVGLIMLIFIVKIYSLLVRNLSKPKTEAVPQAVAAPAAPVTAPIENRQEIIAGIAAAIATVMGKDVEAIRITSFKRVG
ncbi:MAG: OadG family protein [Clostridia bacterium]|nr:OadG family protein [Clostridia bacterium]